MDARNNIATDLFYKIRSRFSGLKLGAETGEITINPEEARFFDFDYMEGEVPIGHVSISLAEPNSMKIYFSHGITETMDSGQKGNWYRFLRELRQFAKRRLLAFDTRDIAKDNLDKRDYAFLSQNANKPQEQTPNTIQKPVGESVMNESAMYGSRTMSYQKLMDTRLIIKHSQAVMDDTQPGARTRHISALFVENQDGERFKYPFIHLAGARAMQRHVANGGLPYDDIGKSIVRMSEEIAQLKSFGNYVVRNDLMNSENNGIVERSSSYLNQLRETIAKLAKQSHYEAYKESFQAQDSLEVPEEVVEDFVEKFTVRNFKEDIKSVFPVLYRLMQENNTIGYDDIVAMTAEEQTNEDIEIDESEDTVNPFDQFEAWVMGLGEQSAIDSENAEEQAQAVKELQELVAQAFPAGVDGTNAIESLKGIIEDPVLYQQIKSASKEDPEADVRPMVQAWLEQKAPEVLDQLDFGDMEQPEAEAPAEEPAAEPGAEAPAEEPAAPAAQPQMADADPEQQRPNKLDTRELAEFIQSFYDRESGTFPKGPEGVCTMVGKKFGEQAEQVARKFVERMAPMQSTKHNPELQELARIKSLAGVQQTNEGSSSFEDLLDSMPTDVEQFKRTGELTDDLYQAAYDYMFQNNISGGRGDTYEQVADFVSDYVDVDESMSEAGEDPDTTIPFKRGEIVKYTGPKTKLLGNSVIYYRPSNATPGEHAIGTPNGMWTAPLDELKPLEGKVVSIPDSGLSDEDVKKLIIANSPIPFKRGEIVKYTGPAATKGVGNTVIYRYQRKNDPDVHAIDTVMGPWDAKLDELEPLEGKVVNVPEYGLGTDEVKKILGAPAERNEALEDIKRLSGISKGMGF